jgi:hypothetical protein
VVCEEKNMSEEKDSSTDKIKKAFSFKLHGPKNPFKGNPYKKKEE